MKPHANALWKNIILMLLILCLLTGGFLWYASVSGEKENDAKTDMKMEGIRLALANLSAARKQSDQDFVRQLKDNLGLLSLPLREIVRRDGDDAIRNYSYGCVLRRDGDTFILPEDQSTIPLLSPQEYEGTMPYTPEGCDPFRDQEGAFWSVLKGEESEEYVLCTYRRLTDDYYYLYYMPLSAVEAFYQTRFDVDSVLSGAEAVYDGYFVSWIEAEDGYRLFYASSVFEGLDQPSDLGISIGREKSGFRPTAVGDARYMVAVSSPKWVSSVGANIRIAYFVPYENYYGATYGNHIILLVIALAFCIVLGVWVLAARRLMAGPVVTRTQRRHYGPRRLRIVAVSLGVIGTVVILLTGMFSGALTDIYYSTTACQGALDTLSAMQSESSEHEARMTAQRSDQYLSYASRIADLLGLYPDLKTREQLSEMSQTIGADYLMLFNDRGSEILTDSRYVNLSFGTEETSSTYDFRRLIAGVPSIVHPACVDEVTGLYRQLIGVSMDDGDVSDGYGSLILAVEPKQSEEDVFTLEDIMRSLSSSGGVIFSVSRDTGIIQNASSPSLAGKNVTELGMNKNSLHDAFMDFFTLNGQDLYGCSIEQAGALFFSAVRTDSMFTDLFRSALIPALIFLAGWILLSLALLAGYTEKRIDASGLTVIDDHDWAYRETEREEILEEKRGWWARKSPERKAGFALMILLAAGIAALIVAYGAGGMGGGVMAIIPYVLSGVWTRGFNLFALTRIVLLIGAVILILLGMKALLSVLCGFLETRGETICRLTCSLLRYVVIIVALFYALEALGFDPTTLLASLGIFSLALSLGAKDLVADVLSGIMIVFSGEYQIGDIVEIAGFRGRVWEIGVRSTTIVNKDGNMKNISNRNVSNVMNLSSLNSRCHVNLAIPYDQPLDQVREMLNRELPVLSRELGSLADGPAFLGVTGLDAGYVTLSFCAECAEEDMDEVCDKMTCALKSLFEKHDIPFK